MTILLDSPVVAKFLYFRGKITRTHFLSRELSWIDFDKRVFYEALRESSTVFEKLNFLSIFSTNLNEFFQVRVAALEHELKQNSNAKDISQESLRTIISTIYAENSELLKNLYEEIRRTFSSLEQLEIFYQSFGFEKKITSEFLLNIKPILKFADFAHLENQKSYVGFCFEDDFGFVRLPKYRIFWLDKHKFTTVDDFLLGLGKELFPGKKIISSFTISVDRDSDLVVTEKGEQKEFILEMEKILELRKFSEPTRILVNAKPSDIELIKNRLEKFGAVNKIIFVDGFVHPEFLIGLKNGFKKYDYQKNVEKETDSFPDMMVRFRSLTKTHRPFNQKILDDSLLNYLDKKDLVVHFPYESYFPILKFISDAAEDKDVSEIKFTIYRTEHNSRIVNELVLASLKGKKITVFMEIKARFNEQLNIDLGKILEDAGIKVIYRLEELKVHAKLALVVRNNARYVILSTGNFNSETSYVYSDLALFSSKTEITQSIFNVFHAIENAPNQFKKNFPSDSDSVFFSPFFIKRKLLSLIQSEAAKGENGLIIAKMNNLGDEEIIQELKKASSKGVKILLNVRGICQILPDENIQIISIVGKYLEHSRLFFFKNSGNEKLFASSSDWMQRNLDRRLEVMFEILDEDCFEKLKNVLFLYFKDDSHAHRMRTDGTWKAPADPNGFCAQEELEKMYQANEET